MLYLFYFDKIAKSEKGLCLLTLGCFLLLQSIVESYILARLGRLFWTLAIAGLLLIGFGLFYLIKAKGFPSRKIGIDQKFYASVVLVSWFFSKIPVQKTLEISGPRGIIFPGLTLSQESFSIVMLTFLAAMAVPAIYEPRIAAEKMSKQGIDFYPEFSFSWRRTVSSLAVIVLFWLSGVLILRLYQHWILACLFVFYWCLFSVLYWEKIYGYRSVIAFALGFIMVASAMAFIGVHSIKSLFEFFYHTGLLIIITRWLVAGIVTIIILIYWALFHASWLKITTTRILPSQRYSHSIMIAVWVLGIMLLYITYLIVPMFRIYNRLGVSV